MYDTRTFASGALHAPIWSSAILLCTKALVCMGSYLRATWRDQARKPANGASINKNPTVAITPAASRCSLRSTAPRRVWERRLVGIVEHSREIELAKQQAVEALMESHELLNRVEEILTQR